jgi:V8-like Glu-specific endopeptidase
MKNRLEHSIALFGFVCVGLSGLAVGCGGAINGPQDDEQGREGALVNGQRDYGHRSVGQLHQCYDDSLRSCAGVCTSTLIGPRTVLTAGHCVGSNPNVLFVVDSGSRYKAAAIHRHPQYRGGNANDIAVITLERAVSGITPSKLPVSAPRVGQTITLVGFGQPDGQTREFGVKRQGRNTISRVSGTTFSFESGTNVCYGDSGGPSFAQDGTVIGVHSTLTWYCGHAGTDMRVDSYLGWIRQVAGADLDGGGGGSSPNPNPAPDTNPAYPSPVVAYRHYSAINGDHWISRNTNVYRYGYRLEGGAFRVFPSSASGLAPLYGCMIGSDHFTSRDKNCEGQRYETLIGYVAQEPIPGVAGRPIYRCYKGGNHLTTTHTPECANNGYRIEHIAGYVP